MGFQKEVYHKLMVGDYHNEQQIHLHHLRLHDPQQCPTPLFYLLGDKGPLHQQLLNKISMMILQLGYQQHYIFQYIFLKPHLYEILKPPLLIGLDLALVQQATTHCVSQYGRLPPPCSKSMGF